MDPEYEVPLAQMRENIKVLPGYTSTMWQVVAISMTVVALLVNALVTGLFGGQPIFGTIAGILLNLLTIGFVWVTRLTLNWFNRVISRSNLVIFHAWERLKEYSVPMGDISDISTIPENPLIAALEEHFKDDPEMTSREIRKGVREIRVSTPHPSNSIRIFFGLLLWSLIVILAIQIGFAMMQFITTYLSAA